MSTTLTAGRELDALVAEKVMGYVWRRFEYPPAGVSFKYGKPWTWLSRSEAGFDVEGDETRYIENVPHYSTDIAAAWLVVDMLAACRFYVCVEHVPKPTDRWNAWVGDKHVSAESAPLAICRAALAVSSPLAAGGDA